MEKELATHSSTLAWKIPWMEEPGRLQSVGLQKVRHDWVTSLFTFTLGSCQTSLCPPMVVTWALVNPVNPLWPHLTRSNGQPFSNGFIRHQSPKLLSKEEIHLRNFTDITHSSFAKIAIFQGKGIRNLVITVCSFHLFFFKGKEKEIITWIKHVNEDLSS